MVKLGARRASSLTQLCGRDTHAFCGPCVMRYMGGAVHGCGPTLCRVSLGFFGSSLAAPGWNRLEPAGTGWNRLEPAGTGWNQLEQKILKNFRKTNTVQGRKRKYFLSLGFFNLTSPIEVKNKKDYFSEVTHISKFFS